MKMQSDSRKYEGQCKFCKHDFTKRQITDHLDDCLKREKGTFAKNLRLRVNDAYAKNYWLVVEVSHEAKLKDLDSLIRDIWVECCDHLSLFGDYNNKIGKGQFIMDVLQPRDTVSYIYDFGSPTELDIEALSYSKYRLNDKKRVELVARNYLPNSLCAHCGDRATRICTYCSEDEITLVCERCADRNHNEERGEHYILSLANSPRSGVCGYEQSGPLDTLF